MEYYGTGNLFELVELPSIILSVEERLGEPMGFAVVNSTIELKSTLCMRANGSFAAMINQPIETK